VPGTSPSGPESVLRELFDFPVHGSFLAPGAATEPLHPEEERALGEVAPRRHREFSAGRTCARRALRGLGRVGLPVLPGPGRAPLWPEGTVGTISHGPVGCAAVVASAGRVAALGLDLEQLGRVRERHWQTILTPGEAERLSAYNEEERSLLGTVAFGAKEALYKCWNPLTGEWLGFQDAEIDFLPHSRHNGEFRARLLVAETHGFPLELRGRWHREEDAVLTALGVGTRDLARAASVA
jgi:4'-phosphopantetheinyl transferase EntD